jgi:hypothetical protein
VQIAAEYSFNNGKSVVNAKYPTLLDEVREVIQELDAEIHRTKESEEKTMSGKLLYSPRSLNSAFKKGFERRNWRTNIRVKCEYNTSLYVQGYKPKALKDGPFREMDYIKENLGVEVQFGKYAFMVYNVAAKMTIFHNLGYIDTGIEIVPVKAFANDMSSGVSYFEQFVWDLENRGVADIDIPVLILGIDS